MSALVLAVLIVTGWGFVPGYDGASGDGRGLTQGLGPGSGRVNTWPRAGGGRDDLPVRACCDRDFPEQWPKKVMPGLWRIVPAARRNS